MEIAMQAQDYISLGVILVFAAAIVGIFSTKTPGFGRYSTTALLLALVLFVAAMASRQGRMVADGEYSLCCGWICRRFDGGENLRC